MNSASYEADSVIRGPWYPAADVSRGNRRRLTVEIGSDLHRQLKLRALQEGETLASLVTALLHQQMDQWTPAKQASRSHGSHAYPHGAADAKRDLVDA